MSCDAPCWSCECICAGSWIAQGSSNMLQMPSWTRQALIWTRLLLPPLPTASNKRLGPVGLRKSENQFSSRLHLCNACEVRPQAAASARPGTSMVLRTALLFLFCCAVLQAASGYSSTSFLPQHLVLKATPLCSGHDFRQARCSQRRPSSIPPLKMQGEESDVEISDAIVKAEAAATPLRPVRMQVYSLLGLGAAAGAVVMGLGIQGGVAAAKPLADSIPIVGSKEVTEGIFAVLAPLCGYFYFAEEQNKQQNLRRIAERVQERRVEVLGANRDERRLKGASKKKDKKRKKAK